MNNSSRLALRDLLAQPSTSCDDCPARMALTRADGPCRSLITVPRRIPPSARNLQSRFFGRQLSDQFFRRSAVRCSSRNNGGNDSRSNPARTSVAAPYAASTRPGKLCANACSQTSRGKELVTDSAHQSRNVERKRPYLCVTGATLAPAIQASTISAQLCSISLRWTAYSALL